MIRILVCDDIGETAFRAIEDQPFRVDALYEKKESLEEIIAQYDGLIVNRKTILDQKLLSKAEKLKVIGSLSKDVWNIDLDYATTRGITVVNPSRGVSASIAEFTMLQLLQLCRQNPQGAVELRGKTLGIIGMGNVGAQLAKRAKAFEMHILCYDPALTRSRAIVYGVEAVSLVDLLILSDMIAIHTPLNETTHTLINHDRLAMMKKGAFLLNNAGAEICDAEELHWALSEGILSGLAMDSYGTFPEKYLPLRSFANVSLSENLSALTAESSVAAAEEVAEEIMIVLQKGMSANAINVPIIPENQKDTYLPYLETAAFLGEFMGQYIHEPIREIEILHDAGLENSAPIVQTLLEYLLRTGMMSSDVAINYVNALNIAKQMDIAVHARHSADITDGLGLKILRKDGNIHNLHANYHNGKQQILRIDECLLETIPQEHILLVSHPNKPGIVGLVGSSLGACSINISSMTLNHLEAPQNFGLMLINIDRPIDENFLKGITIYDNIFDAKYIHITKKHFTKER